MEESWRVANTLLSRSIENDPFPNFNSSNSMSSCNLCAQFHASSTSLDISPEQGRDPVRSPPSSPAEPEVNYVARAQWLRAAVLGANDGLVSVASLTVGVGAVNSTAKAMLVSGMAGLVAGACSMAIGEFVSVCAQRDIELVGLERRRRREKGTDDVGAKEEEEGLPNPWLAAWASALAFSFGALLPLLGGGFIETWGVRMAAVCLVSSLGLAGFGTVAAVLGGADVIRSAVRVLIGGWLAMAATYGVLKLFGLVFDMNLSSS